MTKVVVLSHVKVSSVPSSSASGAGRRIPWQGGKIVSNKEEALRKFYERKVSAGGQFNDHQIEALQKTLGITVGKGQAQHHTTVNGRAHINPKKLHATHRPHGKVQASTNKTLVINGRVLGPKVTKSDNSNSNKAQATRQPQHAVKFVKAGPKTSKFNKNKAGGATGGGGGSPAVSKQIALEDKLHMSLDALVGGNKNNSTNQKCIRK